MTTQKTMCGLCDLAYDRTDRHAHAVHQHFEPQSGYLRTAWLASQLPWTEFEKKMRDYLYSIDERRIELHEHELSVPEKT